MYFCGSRWQFLIGPGRICRELLRNWGNLGQILELGPKKKWSEPLFFRRILGNVFLIYWET